MRGAGTCSGALQHGMRPLVFRYSLRVQSGRTAENLQRVPRGFSSPGVAAMGIFLLFGAAMAALAGTMLLNAGTFLDRLWALNPVAQARLAPLGPIAGVLFLLLGMILAAAGIGWFRRQRWGWRLAVGVIAVQFLGDVVNAILGDTAKFLFGAAIAGALLYYLFRPSVRLAFSKEPPGG